MTFDRALRYTKRGAVPYKETAPRFVDNEKGNSSADKLPYHPQISQLCFLQQNSGCVFPIDPHVFIGKIAAPYGRTGLTQSQ